MNDTERRATALKLFNSLGPTMGNLAGRWSDEFEHESITDYRKVLAPKVEKVGGKITKMLKSPRGSGFGFEYTLAGATYRVTVTASGRYSYSRIK